MQRKKLIQIAFGLLGCVGIASLIHPFGDLRKDPSTADLPAAPAVIFRSCRNCHSERTEWPLYSRIAPMSWMIEKDVHDARAQINLSHWSGYDAEHREQLLSEIGSMVRNRRMPPERYLLLHPEARISDADAEALYQWTRTERRLLRTSR